MERIEIESTLVELVRRELGVAPSRETPGLDRIDSLQRLRLAVAIEDHFRICLDADDEEAVTTLSDLVLLIERKLRG